MELKQPSSVLSTVLILVMNSILSTALPHPDHYGDHLSVHEPFHNAIVDYYVSSQSHRGTSQTIMRNALPPNLKRSFFFPFFQVKAPIRIWLRN